MRHSLSQASAKPQWGSRHCRAHLRSQRGSSGPKVAQTHPYDASRARAALEDENFGLTMSVWANPQKSFRPGRRESPQCPWSLPACDRSGVIRSTFTIPTRPDPANPDDGSSSSMITKIFCAQAAVPTIGKQAYDLWPDAHGAVGRGIGDDANPAGPVNGHRTVGHAEAALPGAQSVG